MTTQNDDLTSGYTEEEWRQADQGPIQEEFPFLSKRLELDSEEQLNQNKLHNAWIIIGRDRPAGLSSGYGRFAANTQNRLIDGRKCSTIDIGVGRYSGFNGNVSRDDVVGNHIQYDAARIYISQKTNIDENFIIKEAGTLEEAIGHSALGLKADVLRLAARENVKIVANTGDPSNASGTRNRSVFPIYGIQLITGIGENATGDNVQGIVKSENLRIMLEALLSDLNSFVGLFGSYIQLQGKFNEAIKDHTHKGIVSASPNGSLEIDKSLGLISAYTQNVTQKLSKIDNSITNLKMNFGVSLKKDYLSISDAKKYIGSIYNKTN